MGTQSQVRTTGSLRRFPSGAGHDRVCDLQKGGVEAGTSQEADTVILVGDKGH